MEISEIILRRINVTKIWDNFKIIYPFTHFPLSNIKGGIKVFYKDINNMVWCTKTDLSRRNVAITKEGWGSKMDLAEIINKVHPIKPYALTEDGSTELASIFLAGNMKRDTWWAKIQCPLDENKTIAPKRQNDILS